MPVVGPPRQWISGFFLFFTVIGGFCGCSVGMAEVGCGLLRLVTGLVEIGVDHGVVGCGLLRVGCGLLRLEMGLVEIGMSHSIVGCGLLRLAMGLVEIGVGHGEVTALDFGFHMVGLWFFSVLHFFFPSVVKLGFF